MSTRRVASATSLDPHALKKLSSTTERARAKTQYRNLQTRTAQLSEFHMR